MLALPDADLLARYDGRAPRFTSYPPIPTWSDTVGPDDYAAALLAVQGDPEPVSLYVHLPFCAERCWYCGCNVVIQKNPYAADPYLEALAVEVARVSERIGRRKVGTLHLGGGTPNFLSGDQLHWLFRVLRESSFDLSGAAIDVEIDPRAANEVTIDTFAELGATRFSFGVQDLDPDVGAAIGRVMDEAHVGRLISRARAAGIRGVNIDLMFGLPKQTTVSLERTVTSLLRHRPDRLAIYGYAHVPWMRPQQRRLEPSGLPGAFERVALFGAAARVLTGAGYLPIGLDHFAVPSDELARAASAGTLRRTFQGYTTVSHRDQIGLGVSAIGRVGGPSPLWVQNTAVEKEYRRQAGLVTLRGLQATDDDVLRGRVIESIMCQLAVRPQNVAHLLDGAGFWARFPDARAALEPMARDGLLLFEADGLEVTELGRFFLRQIAATFDARSQMVALPASPGAVLPSTPAAPRYSASV
ncbi:MAG: oxygen-independent coproporphyrinogen III oxidase [Myxococcales bacterium]|nr:oxygen-independent coproporphyrinogen III oxidase [Myxococcales bacterium]